MFKKINKFAKQVGEELGRTITGIRVMANCLLLYFDKGSCRFYSKKGMQWGNIGTMYIVPCNFNRETITKRMWVQFEDLIKWTEQWIHASFTERLWLRIEYNMRFA